MAHVFGTYEQAEEFFVGLADLNQRTFDDSLQVLHALDQSLEAKFSVRTAHEEGEKLRKQNHGITPFPAPFLWQQGRSYDDAVSAAMEGMEFMCPVEVSRLGGELVLNANYLFEYLLPGASAMESSQSIRDAAMGAKEAFSRRYGGVKVVPVFYTVEDCGHPFMDKVKTGAVLSVMALPYMPEKLKGFFQLIYMTARLAFKSEKPVSMKELGELEDMFGKA